MVASRSLALRAAGVLLGVVLVGANAQFSAASDTLGSARGAGVFLYAATVPMQFAFAATQKADGSATGTFRHAFVFGGFHYAYEGAVTCLAVDSANHRAWIGGVLTRVVTDDPTSTQQAGDDAWFRVLDQSAQTGDSGTDNSGRSTAMGFKGAIPSSAAYCALRLWPAGNARTWPIVDGQVAVR